MIYLTALVSAALYGTGDFLGGVAARQVSAAVVVALSQSSGLLILLLVVGFLPAADPAWADLGWGGLAGLAGSLGVGLLYRALAIGTMGVVAPITAVCAVVLPVGVSALFGRPPSSLTTAGILLALAGIVLVSQQPASNLAVGTPNRRRRAGIAHAFCSGVAIGCFFLVLARARPQSGLWPLVGARAVAVPLAALAALAGGASFRVGAGPLRPALAAGVVDMTANVLYLLASRMGSLAVAVTLSSLYPVSTVVLARAVLGERLHRLQIVGMVAAVLAVACIVLGGER